MIQLTTHGTRPFQQAALNTFKVFPGPSPVECLSQIQKPRTKKTRGGQTGDGARGPQDVTGCTGSGLECENPWVFCIFGSPAAQIRVRPGARAQITFGKMCLEHPNCSYGTLCACLLWFSCPRLVLFCKGFLCRARRKHRGSQYVGMVLEVSQSTPLCAIFSPTPNLHLRAALNLVYRSDLT